MVDARINGIVEFGKTPRLFVFIDGNKGRESVGYQRELAARNTKIATKDAGNVGQKTRNTQGVAEC